ncbi:hypothetical protein R1flu_010474 [Riccia fluitans]|uniref:Uncharacterized protein n=1 Tax=Riccia fluitans TaxID=41844 RepID=A0ABD1Z992_9MARC
MTTYLSAPNRGTDSMNKEWKQEASASPRGGSKGGQGWTRERTQLRIRTQGTGMETDVEPRPAELNDFTRVEKGN